MKLSILASALAIPALLVTNTVNAESYQSFSGISYSEQDRINGKNKSLTLNTTYYFDEKKTLGPLDQFEYINTVSNVFATYQHDEFNSGSINGLKSSSDTDRYSIGGIWVTGKFILGAGSSYSDYEAENNYSLGVSENSDSYHVNLGYLITDNFKVGVTRYKHDDVDALDIYNAQYKVQLNGDDYIGFSYTTNDHFDFHDFSAKYLKKLSNDQYLVVQASYLDDGHKVTGLHFGETYFTDRWAVDTQYYFSKNTSVSMSYDKHENYSLGAKHFFTKNYALAVSYSNNNDHSDLDAFGINFTAQF